MTRPVEIVANRAQVLLEVRGDLGRFLYPDGSSSEQGRLDLEGGCLWLPTQIGAVWGSYPLYFDCLPLQA